MKEPICDLARTPAMSEDRWRRHAARCAECSELLMVIQFMTQVAARTAVPDTLPSAGYILLKNRIRERQLAVERAARPIYAMTLLTGFLLVSVTLATILGTESRLESIMLGAIALVFSQAGVMVLGALFIGAVSVLAAYFVDPTKA